MAEPRVVGMTINHRELDHILTSIADVIRNAAYQVAKPEDFDETGSLITMEELAVKALLQDSLDHYIQFTAGSGNCVNTHMDFNYYLEDNFQMVAGVIKADPAKFSYVSALFAQACGVLSSAIAAAIEDVVQTGQSVERIESFTMGSDNSYYVIHGEPDDEYDAEGNVLQTPSDKFTFSNEMKSVASLEADKIQLKTVYGDTPEKIRKYNAAVKLLTPLLPSLL